MGALRLRSGQASDFELCVGDVHPVFGEISCPSSLQSPQQTVHTEHYFHPIHPGCTMVAPETQQYQLVWRLEIIYPHHEIFES
jgi:hypothetical protein